MKLSARTYQDTSVVLVYRLVGSAQRMVADKRMRRYATDRSAGAHSDVSPPGLSVYPLFICCPYPVNKYSITIGVDGFFSLSFTHREVHAPKLSLPRDYVHPVVTRFKALVFFDAT